MQVYSGLCLSLQYNYTGLSDPSCLEQPRKVKKKYLKFNISYEKIKKNIHVDITSRIISKSFLSHIKKILFYSINFKYLNQKDFLSH